MPEKQQGKWVGKGLKRKEDLRLLTGRGCFMDDIRLPNMKYAAILRSPYPHAWIKGMDISEALKIQGVRGVLTGKDVAAMSQPFPVGVPIPPK
jgi:2-furoyl-CoA dehydrogenase large subunit